MKGIALVSFALALGGSDAGKAPPALSFGSGSCGKLQGGVSLPCSGPNYEAHTATACVLGRNFLHPLVEQTVIEAFDALAHDSKRRWQYGEMGKVNGGRLWPHKTHQNGLAADFFMPVVNQHGEPAQVPVTATNKFGYGLEFDNMGALGDLSIDWKALGKHLLALEAVGRAHQVRIARIIITPQYHRRLFQENPELKRLEPLFMKKEAWVRHDEHYHVDFQIPENLTRSLKCPP